jgi:hypothetical protein
MSLIIEDGTEVANANSYVTLAEARAYALARGTTLSATDSAVEILVIKSMDYLESLDAQFKGFRKTSTQALCWPRDGVYRSDIGTEYPAIPNELKNGLCQLVLDSNSFDISPNTLLTDKGQVIEQRVEGAIDVKYAQGETITRPTLRKFDNLIYPLLKNQSFGASALAVRF